MAYVLSDLITRVQQRVKDTAYSTSEITSYINDTQNDVFNEYRLPFMETSQDYTLVANVADITNGVGLPTNFVQAIDLTMTADGMESVLNYVPYQEIMARYPEPTDITAHPSGIPQYWYQYGTTIRVYPAPISAYTVNLSYLKKPTALSGASDVPQIPSEFEEMLVVGAAYRVLQVKDMYDEASVLQNKYDELLQKLVNKYSLTQAGHATRMRINRHAVGATFR